MKSILLTIASFLCFNGIIAQDDARTATKKELKTIKVFNGVGEDEYNLKQYEADEVVVSSTLPHKNDIYNKDNLVDGDPNTAWVEGRDNDGKGDNLAFIFNDGTPPDVIAITPGYNKDDATWNKNNRVSKIMIQMYQKEEAADGDGLLSEIEVELETDENGKITPGKQYIQLTDLYMHHMGYTEFEVCVITIVGIDAEGAKYNDTCISEVEFFVRAEE